MRRGYFIRQSDVSGMSGTGAVCEFVELSDGRIILRWLTYLSSLAIYNSIDDAVSIHGHRDENGVLQTDVVWVDEEASQPPVATERAPGWEPPAQPVASDDPAEVARAALKKIGLELDAPDEEVVDVAVRQRVRESVEKAVPAENLTTEGCYRVGSKCMTHDGAPMTGTACVAALAGVTG